ncbi:MAG: LLM class flavin-dependent oxidoreductase [bacterium]|jgi:alkanesulfonate monooxygenase SsuD/methylene tetrahydromethanopterin reductase-like flavin-dependent oxidoreductase (luciferase family)|nr:LLM class flavin-dependent oxidoreductase [bacterium]
MATTARADQLREASNPLFNDRRLRLGTFSSNLSHGCAISTIDGVLEADWSSTLALARMADEMEFEALVPVGRWKGFGGVTNFNGAGFESFTWASAISASTRYSSIFATSHVPTMHPVLAAKQGATIDHVSGGRFTLNIVTGWFRPEIEMFGAPQMDHAVRYDCAEEWLEIIKRLWTEDEEFDYEGRFYKVTGARLAPRPVQQPHPVIMNAGGSDRGRHYAAKLCDVVFILLDSHDPDEIRAKVDGYRRLAREEYGRELLVWSYGYVVQGDTDRDAQAYWDYYVNQKGDWEAATTLVTMLGINAQTVPEDRLAGLKQHFIAGWGGYPLIGQSSTVVDQLSMLVDAGFDGVLLSWPRYIEDMQRFQQETYPLLAQAGLR